ncbi:hypothetical protein FOG51_01075 [Hanseniaspora uvarum]|nr:hypothetical protein FOG51_01075 [Hanseniaspora uvarum]
MESLNDHQKDVFQQFLDISMFQAPSTEGEQVQLIQFLSSNDWILESSISKYFDQSSSIEVRENFSDIPPPIPDSSTRPEQGIASLIPQTNNPMMNDLLTRMRFPTIININNDIIFDNLNRMVMQRKSVDRVLKRNGFFITEKRIAKNRNNVTTNLNKLSVFLYESNPFLWVLWPLISVLDLFWSGLKFFLGLSFLFGEDVNADENPNPNVNNVIVPLPYFKATEQLDIFELDEIEDEKDDWYAKQRQIIDLYNLEEYRDPSMKDIIQISQPELLHDLDHIDLSSTSHDIQYETKIKSKILFYTILDDSFCNISREPTLESKQSNNILTKILPSDEVKQFLQEKDQCSIFVQDTAVQVSPWIHYKAVKGSSKKLQTPLVLVMGKVDGLLSLIGSFNLASIKSSKSLVKKLQTFVDKYDVPLGLSLQRYELLDLEYSRKLREQQNLEFEKSVMIHTEKKNKKQKINNKFLQMLKFGVDHLLNYQSDNVTQDNVKPCKLQIKMPDGGRIVLNLNPLEYTVKKLYALVEVIQFLNITRDIEENSVRTALADKVEECILNQDLTIFKVIHGISANEIEELDELEIEDIINAEYENNNLDNCFINENEYFVQLNEDNELFPKDFSIVSPFPRVVIDKSDDLLIDDKNLYPRSNVCIEVYDDEEE